MCILLSKLEDWDIIDQEKFPHMVTHKYIIKIYYDDTRVVELERMKWVHDVEQSGLLNMLLVPH